MLTRYVRGETDTDEQAAIEAHLTTCEHCCDVSLPGARALANWIDAGEPLFIPN